MTDEKRSRIKELEEMLSYLVNDSMTLEEKLKSLSDAYWEASNSGYGDAMANKPQEETTAIPLTADKKRQSALTAAKRSQQSRI